MVYHGGHRYGGEPGLGALTPQSLEGTYQRPQPAQTESIQPPFSRDIDDGIAEGPFGRFEREAYISDNGLNTSARVLTIPDRQITRHIGELLGAEQCAALRQRWPYVEEAVARHIVDLRLEGGGPLSGAQVASLVRELSDQAAQLISSAGPSTQLRSPTTPHRGHEVERDVSGRHGPGNQLPDEAPAPLEGLDSLNANICSVLTKGPSGINGLHQPDGVLPENHVFKMIDQKTVLFHLLCANWYGDGRYADIQFYTPGGPITFVHMLAAALSGPQSIKSFEDVHGAVTKALNYAYEHFAASLDGQPLMPARRNPNLGERHRVLPRQPAPAQAEGGRQLPVRSEQHGLHQRTPQASMEPADSPAKVLLRSAGNYILHAVYPSLAFISANARDVMHALRRFTAQHLPAGH